MRLRPLALLLSLTLAGAARAQDATEAATAMPILLKVLTYDLNFDTRGAGEFVIMVAFNPAQSGLREQVMSTLKALPVTHIKSRPLKFVSFDMKDGASLSAEIARVKASAIMATQGLSVAAQEQIAGAAESAQVYSLALDATMVEKFIAIGVTIQNSRPQIVINDKASKAQGARFQNSVLRLAKVIQ
jgi:hypothetical protein